MGFSDLHIHSINSYDGTASISAILKYASANAELNVVAITDHDTMSGFQKQWNWHQNITWKLSQAWKFLQGTATSYVCSSTAPSRPG